MLSFPIEAQWDMPATIILPVFLSVVARATPVGEIRPGEVPASAEIVTSAARWTMALDSGLLLSDVGPGVKEAPATTEVCGAPMRLSPDGRWGLQTSWDGLLLLRAADCAPVDIVPGPSWAAGFLDEGLAVMDARGLVTYRLPGLETVASLPWEAAITWELGGEVPTFVHGGARFFPTDGRVEAAGAGPTAAQGDGIALHLDGRVVSLLDRGAGDWRLRRSHEGVWVFHQPSFEDAGVVLPVFPLGGLVSDDGALAALLEDGRVELWRTSDAQKLWERPLPEGEIPQVAGVGRAGVVLRRPKGDLLLSPVDGQAIWEITLERPPALPRIAVAGADPRDLRPGALNPAPPALEPQPPPAPHGPADDPLAHLAARALRLLSEGTGAPAPGKTLACQRQEIRIALLAPFPALQRKANDELAGRCQPVSRSWPVLQPWAPQASLVTSAAPRLPRLPPGRTVAGYTEVTGTLRYDVGAPRAYEQPVRVVLPLEAGQPSLLVRGAVPPRREGVDLLLMDAERSQRTRVPLLGEVEGRLLARSLELPEEGPIAALVDGDGLLRWWGEPEEAEVALARLSLETLSARTPRRAAQPRLSWEADEEIIGLYPLDDGAVLVQTLQRIGVLDASGRLRWERRAKTPRDAKERDNLAAAGSSVLVEEAHIWSMLDAEDGDLRWQARFELEALSPEAVLTRQGTHHVRARTPSDGTPGPLIGVTNRVSLRGDEVWMEHIGRARCGRGTEGASLGCEPILPGEAFGALRLYWEDERLVAREGEDERWSLEGFEGGRMQVAGEQLLLAPPSGPWVLVDDRGRVTAVLLGHGPAAASRGRIWVADGARLRAWEVR